MAKYRPIFTKIWNDPDFEGYTPQQKLIFLFLCTNPLTTESGIYPISCKTISQNTGIKLCIVQDNMTNNKIKNVLYDVDNKVVFVCNFKRYNGGGNPVNVAKSIKKDYEYIKTPLWNEFLKRYPEYAESLTTFGKPLANGSIPNLIHNPKHNPNPLTYSTDGAISNFDYETDKIPFEEMMDIFVKHWKKHHKGNYLPNRQKDQEVARRLYQQCIKDFPEDPLRVFRRKVERLYAIYKIKYFSGLESYWNQAAGEKERGCIWTPDRGE